MNHLLLLGILVIALLAVTLVSVSGRHRQEGVATGQLSRETLRRDPIERHGSARGRELEHVLTPPMPVVVPASTAPTVWVPPDAEALGVTRRQFLNRSIITFVGLSIASFSAAAFTAFLWPPPAEGFGGLIRLGKVSDLLDSVKKAGGFYYVPDGRMWVTAYPAETLAKAEIAYQGEACLPGMEAGINCLYQKCVHLGCRVPACLTSQWFECPCHGSQYNRVGEKRGGPAPRGLDRFPVSISSDGVVTADTASAKIILGPPIGTDTTGQQAEGPHCV